MRIFNKSLAVAACVAAVTFGAVAPPAYAGVTLYENANYDWGSYDAHWGDARFGLDE